MDILRFINSKDIRKHLKDTGYEFNSLEAAWLIYQCRNATIREKHKAWNELMDLEFYTEELKGTQKTLIGLSSFIKGKIDPALFARAYHQIITSGYAADSMPRAYLRSGLILAGLSDDEKVQPK